MISFWHSIIKRLILSLNYCKCCLPPCHSCWPPSHTSRPLCVCPGGWGPLVTSQLSPAPGRSATSTPIPTPIPIPIPHPHPYLHPYPYHICTHTISIPMPHHTHARTTAMPIPSLCPCPCPHHIPTPRLFRYRCSLMPEAVTGAGGATQPLAGTRLLGHRVPPPSPGAVPSVQVPPSPGQDRGEGQDLSRAHGGSAGWGWGRPRGL